MGITPAERLRSLRDAIESKGFVRLIEAHSGLSGIVAEEASVEINGTKREFDGLWESSLTDAGSKGLPDASIVGTESRLHTINEVLQVTRKPILVDGDTGGDNSQFEFLVTQLERIGVSGVIIEDKIFPKRNSLDPASAQTLEDPLLFAEKIESGRAAALSPDFLIIARIESLIAGTGLQDALQRAEHYVAAGVDGIMIHSALPDPDDLFAFVDGYELLCNREGRRPLLVSVPTTYNQHHDTDLAKIGFDVVIHANHLLRASHRAMVAAAEAILTNDRSKEADDNLSTVKQIFATVGFDRLSRRELMRNKLLQVSALIPAAGKDPSFPDRPKSMIQVAGKDLLAYQLEAIHQAGLRKVAIVRGFEGSQFDEKYSSNENVDLYDNPDFMHHDALHSVMVAAPHVLGGFVMVFSDIIFDSNIVTRLIGSGKDIAIAIDNSYAYHQHEVDKKLDLVVARRNNLRNLRSLKQEGAFELTRIGKNIPISQADYEFTGIAYFSEAGKQALIELYDECEASSSPFHEAISWDRATMTDMLQEMIDRGLPVHGIPVDKGWMEIHNQPDVGAAESQLANIYAPK